LQYFFAKRRFCKTAKKTKIREKMRRKAIFRSAHAGIFCPQKRKGSPQKKGGEEKRGWRRPRQNEASFKQAPDYPQKKYYEGEDAAPMPSLYFGRMQRKLKGRKKINMRSAFSNIPMLTSYEK